MLTPSLCSTTRIARRKGIERIFAGIAAARAAGLAPVKINTVVIRGLNDDEVPDFVRFARAERVEVRFIELMPTSGLGPECKELGGWRPALVVKGAEVRARVEDAFGPLAPVPDAGGVASVFRLDDGTRLGFIAPLSEPFCRGCGRLRLGPDGRLRVCLFDRAGTDLRRALREGTGGPAALEGLIRSALASKATWERGALEALTSEMFRIGG